jgi:hypothetical protein
MAQLYAIRALRVGIIQYQGKINAVYVEQVQHHYWVQQNAHHANLVNLGMNQAYAILVQKIPIVTMKAQHNVPIVEKENLVT